MNPVLRTPRLTLRPPAPEDAPRLAALSSDPRIARMVSAMPYPNTPEAVGAFVARQPLIEAEGGRVWTICDSEGPQGMVGLHADPLRRAEADLGYWLAAAVWGRGYATEAARAAIAEGFARGGSGEGFAEIAASCFLDNPASGNVLRKIGFLDAGKTGPLFSLGRGEEAEAAFLRMERGRRPAPLPFLETERLILAPLQDEEAAALAAVGDAPEIARWMARLPSPFTEAAALERIRRSRFRGAPGFRLGLRRKAEGDLIGEWGVGPADPSGAPDLSYWLGRAHRGRGYAREATQALLGYLFEAFDAPRIRAEASSDNAPSRALLEALGFSERGAYLLGEDRILRYDLQRTVWIIRRKESAT